MAILVRSGYIPLSLDRIRFVGLHAIHLRWHISKGSWLFVESLIPRILLESGLEYSLGALKELKRRYFWAS
jgi:hypothetical protein